MALNGAADGQRTLPDQVEDICRLHWARQGHPKADVKGYDVTGRPLSYLRVLYTEGDFTMPARLVGVYDGRVDDDTVRLFRSLDADTPFPLDLVYSGEAPSPEVARLARDRRIRLRSFEEYQRALWDHTEYVRAQTDRLEHDGIYPLDRHVDKRWAFLGQQPGEATAARQILEWLHTDGPRFVLVLGDFGTGKSFLARVLAQTLAESSDLVPVLVTTRDLEKGRTLDELLGQHMAKYRPDDPFHARSFRYLLSKGRIALLFDGFDELAHRPTYDRVRLHFETLRQAADGSAKVVATSRHQHFVSDAEVLNELGRDVQSMGGAQIIRLFPLDSDQQRTMVEQAFDGSAAEAFLRDLGSVPNLPELTTNPRMLMFLMARRDSLTRLVQAGQDAEPMTAGRLYQALLTDWLEHEVKRQTVDGGAKPLSVEQRREALRQLAVLLWRTGRVSVALGELGELAESITDLAAWQGRTGEAAHAIGAGTVLVRTVDDEFSFIHQSVLEWFVADGARLALADAADDRSAFDAFVAGHMLTPLMADFLCDLAGRRALIDWARAVAEGDHQPATRAKGNAALILQRTDTQLRVRQTGGQIVAANYAGQDLRGQDLSRQDLSGANLSGAILDGAVLPRKLAMANLSGARLAGARLDGASLISADLSGADLRGARLVGANLRGARLTDTRLDRAVLLGAELDAGALGAASTFGAALPKAAPSAQFSGNSSVNAVAVLHATALLVTGHNDGTVRLWDANAGLMLQALPGNARPVTALGVDPRDAWVAAGNDNGDVRLWDPVTGALLRTLEGHTSRVRTLVVAPDGGWLASASDDRTVRIWNPATGAQQHELNAGSGPVWALAAAPDGAWLVSASDDWVVRVWDPVTGALLRTLEGHTSRARALAVAPDGTWLAIGSGDGRVRMLDAATGREMCVLEGHDDCVRSLAVAPDGGWLASASDDRTVRVWDPLTGAHRRALPSSSVREAHALVVAPDGAWLAAASDDQKVRVWDPSTGAHRRTLPSTSVRGPHALAVAPDGGWLASGSDDRTVRVWDLATGARLRTLKGHGGWVRALAAAPDGGRLASASDDGAVRVWDAVTGALLRTLEGHTSRVRALAVVPDGGWLASGSGDRTVRIWNLVTGEQLRTLQGHDGWALALVFAPDGGWLASGSDDRTVLIWDPATGARLRTLAGHTGWVRGLAVAPDGRWLASASDDRTVRIWDPATGALQRTLEGHTSRVRALAVARDGGWLASASDDRTVRIWDPATGADLHILEGHAGEVTALAGVHGARLASAGEDGTVRLWDATAGRQLAVLVADEDGWAALYPDGSYRLAGAPANVWWTAGLCRFEPDEIDEIARYVPALRRVSEAEPRGG